MRKDKSPALWVNDERERLAYDGLGVIITRRSKQAGVVTPSIHSMRRLFYLTMLRAGVKIFSLQLLSGHSDLQVMRRYLIETDSDLKAVHELGNPLNIQSDHL